MKSQLFFICFLLLGTLGTAQELVGPAHVLPGTLTSFEVIPEQKASWRIVTPLSDVGRYQVDTGLSKLYFSSPERGRYTVIAGIIIDDKPELLVKTFMNGDAELEPIPSPPMSLLETWVNTQLPILVKSNNLTSESRLVADCFEHIIHRIEIDNIKTAQNARTQLQITLTGTLALASPTAVTDWMAFLTQLSPLMENELGDQMSDLAAVKTMLQKVANIMKRTVVPEDDAILTVPSQEMNSPNTRALGIQSRVLRNVLAR